MQTWLTEHLHDHYALYGEHIGMLTARKHMGWALRPLPGGVAFCDHFNSLPGSREQLDALTLFFEQLAQQHSRWPQAAHAAGLADACDADSPPDRHTAQPVPTIQKPLEAAWV